MAWFLDGNSLQRLWANYILGICRLTEVFEFELLAH